MGTTVITAVADNWGEKAIDYFGAEVVFNYQNHDLAGEVRKLTGGQGTDVVTDNIGNPRLWQGAISSLVSQGRLVTAGGSVFYGLAPRNSPFSHMPFFTFPSA